MLKAIISTPKFGTVQSKQLWDPFGWGAPLGMYTNLAYSTVLTFVSVFVPMCCFYVSMDPRGPIQIQETHQEMR